MLARRLFAVACWCGVAACAREAVAPIDLIADVSKVDSDELQADLNVSAGEVQSDAIASDAPIEAWTGPCGALKDVGLFSSHCPATWPQVGDLCCEEGLECHVGTCNYMGLTDVLKCESDGQGALRWQQVAWCDPPP